MSPKSIISPLTSRQTKGFTLIELLVVISIISILIAVGAVSYQKSVKLSRDSKRKTDLEQIRQALETYRSEVGSYPDTGSLGLLESGSYLNELPSDPKDGTYAYTKGAGATYTICAQLELATDPTDPCNYSVSQP